MTVRRKLNRTRRGSDKSSNREATQDIGILNVEVEPCRGRHTASKRINKLRILNYQLTVKTAAFFGAFPTTNGGKRNEKNLDFVRTGDCDRAVEPRLTESVLSKTRVSSRVVLVHWVDLKRITLQLVPAHGSNSTGSDYIYNTAEYLNTIRRT